MNSENQTAASNPQGGVGGDTQQELKAFGIGGEFHEGERVQVQGQVIKILPNGICVIQLEREQHICAPVENCQRIVG